MSRRRTLVYLHEGHVAKLLIVPYEHDTFSVEIIAEKHFENEPGTDHLPFLTMVSTAWAIWG